MRGRHLVVVPCLLLLACGSALSKAESDFRKGRYPEAKEAFERSEAESRAWDNRRRAEYSLYRGLTHGALGDRAAALLWLREAKAIEDARPGTLSGDDHTRLELGLEAFDPAESPPPAP